MAVAIPTHSKQTISNLIILDAFFTSTKIVRIGSKVGNFCHTGEKNFQFH